MQYDPIKRSLGNVFNKTPFLRKIFYRMLDLLLLRAWHVHKELRSLTPELLRREREGGVQVLDAGAGFGQYSYWINRKHPGWNILALDVKDEQVADCNRFFSAIGAKKVRFEVGDLTTYVKSDTYDLVVCVDVMEHIEPDVQVFRNYHASMKTAASCSSRHLLIRVAAMFTEKEKPRSSRNTYETVTTSARSLINCGARAFQRSKRATSTVVRVRSPGGCR